MNTLANTVSMCHAVHDCREAGRAFNWYDADAIRSGESSSHGWPHQQLLIYRKANLSLEMHAALDELDIARRAMRRHYEQQECV